MQGKYQYQERTGGGLAEELSEGALQLKTAQFTRETMDRIHRAVFGGHN